MCLCRCHIRLTFTFLASLCAKAAGSFSDTTFEHRLAVRLIQNNLPYITILYTTKHEFGAYWFVTIPSRESIHEGISKPRLFHL